MLFIHRPMNATALHKYSPYIRLAHTTHFMCSCPPYQWDPSTLHHIDLKVWSQYLDLQYIHTEKN